MFFKICNAYARFLNALIVILGFILLFSVAVQVAGRYVPGIPPWLWPLDVTNFTLIWSIFIGSVIGVRDGKHFFVDIFGRSVHPAVKLVLRIIYYICLAAMTFVFTYYGWFYFKDWGLRQTSENLDINLGWLYVAVPFAGVSFLLFMIEGIVKEFIVMPIAEGGE